ncbi:hypothetical protein KC19_7G043500 [Ceratodon purpureus]|uniref:ABC transporter domain-containing protein n=1 Tax=Ceratodon purpureus TaxID=3225 RepID=A0A8T0H7I7_CERPU|nr:hypothetical protein KC19_7G043500 [Ceratodon purpureus]
MMMDQGHGGGGGYGAVSWGSGGARPAPLTRPPGPPGMSIVPPSRRAALQRRQVVGDEEAGNCARLTWSDLWVSVNNYKGEHQRVLHGVSGYAEPGEMLAIMGPSGSGKSTLLDSLAGRLSPNATLKGDILVNGRKKQLSFGMAAYVTQSDELIGTLTVRETIYYSAQLRLSSATSAAEKKAIVESTILEMGLQDCADTPIGNWHIRGLSGGEKRRVSIAIEILTRPRMLFLDEPTSGLDSASAYFVITTLKNLARDGRTVIASIHQPSSEVFDLFENLFLLSSGQTIFFGAAASAHEHFAASGFPCPHLRNPSDHFLRTVNADFDRVKTKIKGSFKHRDLEARSYDLANSMTANQAVKVLVESYMNSEYYVAALSRMHEINHIKGTILESGGSQAGFFRQCFTLMRRSYVNMSRDMGYYWLRLVIYIMLTVCIGSIYFKVGNEFSAIMGRAGCMSYVAGFLTFMSIGGFPSFVEDMKVFSRERLNGHYGVAAFVIGNSLSSLPFLFLISLVSGTIVYFMVQLHPGWDHFVYFVLMLFACVACVESLMMAVASVVPNFLMGIITGAGIQGIFMLVAGFFRLPNDLPKFVWKYPMSYIGFHMYALQGMYQNDFLGLTFSNFILNGVSTGAPISGDYVVEQLYQIDTSRSKWEDLAVVFGMVIGYRIIFFIMIKFSENFGPKLRSKFINPLVAYFTNRSPAVRNTIRPLSIQPSPAHDSVPLRYQQIAMPSEFRKAYPGTAPYTA